MSCARSSTSWRATDTFAPEPRAGREALRSLGVVGGTFNPPHVGHLAIAEHALRELSLSRVVLTPARWPPHKPVEREPGADRRLEMCRLLLAGVARVEVCALELERDGPSYTVDTLDAIHASHPEAELTLIVGADIAATIPAWHEPRRLFELADVAVAARPGADRRSVIAALEPLAPSESRVRFLESPLVEVSSSLVRERAAAGEPLEELVGPGVAGYIAEHGLYGTRAREASR
ncbi:MAG TPA: nicotinate (nicotinamide) nucleotide adenylyltransferase [Solirubrobacteraceae bacterium]|nr:nicotinate (nicotinamide) nucleotide adenylyltransferase [Solirubrobacteraceae bacterium]